MLQEAVDSYEAKVRIYWKLSSAFRGKSEERITVSQANKTLRDTFAYLGPHRPLISHLSKLRDDIIRGKPMRSKVKASCVKLPMKIAEVPSQAQVG